MWVPSCYFLPVRAFLTRLSHVSLSQYITVGGIPFDLQRQQLLGLEGRKQGGRSYPGVRGHHHRVRRYRGVQVRKRVWMEPASTHPRWPCQLFPKPLIHTYMAGVFREGFATCKLRNNRFTCHHRSLDHGFEACKLHCEQERFPFRSRHGIMFCFFRSPKRRLSITNNLSGATRQSSAGPS